GKSGYSPDGRWLVQNGNVSHVGSGVAIQVVPATEYAWFVPPVFSDDNRLLAMARIPQVNGRQDWDRGSVIVFELTAGAKVVELPTGRPLIYAFSPGCQRLAVIGMEETAIWDLPSAKPAQHSRVQGSIGPPPITFSPDGRRLITGHNDCTALVWDVPARVASAPLTAVDCATAWADLASPDAKGFAAVGRLTDDPK